MTFDLMNIITTAWDSRADLTPTSAAHELRDAVRCVLDQLDSGDLRVAAPMDDNTWQVNEWVKKAILLHFRLTPSAMIPGTPQPAYDKINLKTAGWSPEEFQAANFRQVPGSYIRHGAFIGPDVILMPSFVNIGAYVGAGTMVDTWVTIGSCAQIGARCHISGGVGIGGVLEPLQANPVIIEDDCFIGARSEIAEGVIVERGSIVSMGCFIGASTKIVDRATGAISYGRIPAYSVVVPGALPKAEGGPALACVVIIKTVDERSRQKTSINDLLRG